MPAMFDRRGRLTAYAFSCGYIEIAPLPTTVPGGRAFARAKLWREHGTYLWHIHDGNNRRVAYGGSSSLARARRDMAYSRKGRRL